MKKFNNNHGVTVIEMMIGIGLVAMLTTIMVSTQLFVTKDQLKLKNQLEDSIDTNLAERILFMDFNGIDPSYNNLTLLDDNKLLFFDYYPDIPANSVPGRLDRNIQLGLGSGSTRKELVILIQDIKAGPLSNYDPVAAYDVGQAPDDFNTAASLQFQGLNRNRWVSKLYQTSNPDFWKNGRMVMLDTPARLRPVDTNGNVNMKIAPRSPVFVGLISGEAVVSDALIKNAIDMRNPQTNILMDSVDTFLRRAPSIGGGQAIVRLRPVRLIRYYVEPQKDNTLEGTPALLYKQTYESGRWSSPMLLADKVESLQLKRDSVLKRMIYFKVNKSKKKDTQQTAGL
ncbi:hypothetical protein EZJ49_09750 [Bdellovibrio bacteriovorus]|uniref:hypothetical protein n=1 Tax=Bdellovibrio bacteriovorus TaxID=959 RepID=UPI0021D0396D|nr:hypothetical protein [Bdellovibrio bacteriovorus]UXR63358.1 hypothetical protein EZJ49_09750 [Bdellovibrio bacteriovorus]